MRSKLLRASLGDLLVFDAAATAGSFSEAARLLGMTQSAVSHHIAALERSTGVKLFDRVWRGVVPTSAGRDLHAAVDGAFGDVDRALGAVARRANRRRITIHTDFAVAAHYLMPRLEALRAASGGAEIRILTAQFMGDVELGPTDLAIVFGAASQFAPRTIRLAAETVVPLAAPSCAAAMAAAGGAFPAGARLLHLESERGDWLDWETYAALAGLRLPSVAGGLTLNNHQLLIEAALTGEGVALGWRPLVDGLIETGRLVAVGAEIVRPRHGYFLVSPAPRPTEPEYGRLVEAIVEDFAALIGAGPTLG